MAAISKAIARAELRRLEDPEWNHLLADMEKQLVKQNSKKLKPTTPICVIPLLGQCLFA